MPTYPIQLKRNGTAAATPSSLLHGEVALNYADGKLFWKDASNVIQSFTFQAYALASHTHAASDITSGTLDAARIANDSITYAKLQNVSATDRLLGRASAGSGDVEEITCTAFGRSLIGSADAAAARTTLSVQPTASPAFTGAATVTNDGNVVPLTVTNAGTANSFVVNDASGDASPFVIDASGNVGIGTSSPACILDLRVANTGSLGPQVNLWNTGTFNNTNSCRIGFATDAGGSTTTPNAAVDAVQVVGAGGGTELRFLTWNGSSLGTRVTVGHTGQLLVTAGSASACGVAFSGDPDTGIAQLSAAGANTLSICTNSAERVRVDASGNVGIGVTPGAALHVFGNNGIFGTSAFFGINASTAGVAIGNSGTIGQIQGQTAAGTGTAANISLQANGGEVLVGTTTDNGAYLLQVNSQIYATNATIATSDVRFKTNVEALTDATAVIEALRPVAFDFIPHAERNFATERQVGLIAQEAQSALAGTDYADSVVAQCGDHLGLAYEKLVPVLVKALQESNARIAALEERLNHA